MDKTNILQDISVDFSQLVKKHIKNIKKLDNTTQKEFGRVFGDMKDLLDDLSEQSMNEAKFNDGHDLIDYFDGKSEFKKYRNKDASYDDSYYTIPLSVVKKVLGWDKNTIKKINKGLESYSGSIFVTGDEVHITGEA